LHWAVAEPGWIVGTVARIILCMRMLLFVVLAGFGASARPGGQAYASPEDDSAIVLGALAAVVAALVAGWIATQLYPWLSVRAPVALVFAGAVVIGWAISAALAALVAAGAPGSPHAGWLLATAIKSGAVGAFGMLWLWIRRRPPTPGLDR